MDRREDLKRVVDLVMQRWLESFTQLEMRNNIPRVILIETSVFSTILVNSSKLILPSLSLSASMMVLSTICRKARLVGLSESIILSFPSPVLLDLIGSSTLSFSSVYGDAVLRTLSV